MNKSTTRTACQPWGEHAGEPVYLFKMENADGAYVELTNYGATLVSAVVPDAHGVYNNVVLGFPSLQAYLDDDCYIGSTIGRYANRIGGASFKLDGTTWHLENNDGENTNHGGSNGFNTRVFKYAVTAEGLFFTIRSSDGDGGYPGSLELTVHYMWTDMNELIISYYASTDKRTIANFTNHAYFNLSDGDLTILDHQLQINADRMVAAGDDYIPTGEIVTADEVILDRERGINSYYILNNTDFAAKLIDPSSGRTLTVKTSYPGVFLYTGDYLNSKHLNLNNRRCQPFEGLCLECQHYPDAMNRPEFPSALLPKHHVYNEFINYKFGVI